MRSRAALNHRPFRTPLFAYTPQLQGVRLEARLSSQPFVHVSLPLPLPLLPRLLLLLLLPPPLPVLLLMLPPSLPPMLVPAARNAAAVAAAAASYEHATVEAQCMPHVRTSQIKFGLFRIERQRPLSD